MGKRYGLMCGITMILLGAVVVAADRGGGGSAARVAPASARSVPTSWADFCPGVWPAYYGVSRTDSLATAINCNGQLGTGFGVSENDQYGYPAPSFEMPSGSGKEYLFGGALWIGGVVNGDTLVSVGADGWMPYRELYWPQIRQKVFAVTPQRSEYDETFRAEMVDTFTTSGGGVNLQPDEMSGQLYRPLGVRVVLKEHASTEAELAGIRVYEVIVTNVSQDLISGAYVGLYLDGDVSYRGAGEPYDGYTDDAVGSLPEAGVGYMLDVDGDPVDGSLADAASVPSAIAAIILRSSNPNARTNFNWWISHGYSALDYGPRQKADSFDFGTGTTGTPSGDRNKYHVLSYPEWDYDMIMTRFIDSTDSIWRPYLPTIIPALYDNGTDVRMLLSSGPFEIEPDSSIWMQFAIFGGGAVHQLADNGENLGNDPLLWQANLNFATVRENAIRADMLGQKSFDPLGAVTGVQVAHRSGDSIVLRWDAPLAAGIDGYEIYLAEVPDSALPYPGLLPPWYRADSLRHATQVGSVTECVLTELDTRRFYALNVASRVGTEVGALGAPVMAGLYDVLPAAPVVTSENLHLGELFAGLDQPFTLDFAAPAGMSAAGYHVYKFVDSIAAMSVRQSYYSCSGTDTLIPLVDSFASDSQWVYYYSMVPYATIPAGIAQFTDTARAEGTTYVISAIDEAGFESTFAAPLTVRIPQKRTKDVLVVTKSREGASLFSGLQPQINEFYAQALAGYSYDFYFLIDSIYRQPCSVYAAREICLDWRNLSRYKLVIIDDDFNDRVLDSQRKGDLDFFRRYVASGGNLAYFGSFFGYFYSNWVIIYPPRIDRTFLNGVLGVDSVTIPDPSNYDRPDSISFVPDTLYGFLRAEAGATGTPEVTFDMNHHPFPSEMLHLWPDTTAPFTSVMKGMPSAEVTHLYRSKYPEQSLFEGQPVGIRFNPLGGENRTYSFGFHLWYMKLEEARELLHWMLPLSPTGIADEGQEVPATFALSQNYPNPFNPSTVIAYDLPKAGHVTLEIFNILGQRVRLLSDGMQQAGQYRVEWQGSDEDGHPVASGVYLYRLRTGERTESRKMLLLR